MYFSGFLPEKHEKTFQHLLSYPKPYSAEKILSKQNRGKYFDYTNAADIM